MLTPTVPFPTERLTTLLTTFGITIAAEEIVPRGLRQRRRTRRANWLALYGQAREGYREFVQLTNYLSGRVSGLAFHVIGFGRGSRKLAARQAGFDSLSSSGLSRAVPRSRRSAMRCAYCERALKHAPERLVTSCSKTPNKTFITSATSATT